MCNSNIGPKSLPPSLPSSQTSTRNKKNLAPDPCMLRDNRGKWKQPTLHPAKFEEVQLEISQWNTVQQAPHLSKNLVSPMISLTCSKLPWDDQLWRFDTMWTPSASQSHSMPSSTGWGEKNTTKGSWVEVRAGREISHKLQSGKADSMRLTEFIAKKIRLNNKK